MRPTPHSHGARKKAARSRRDLRTQRRRFRAEEKEREKDTALGNLVHNINRLRRSNTVNNS